MDPMGLLRRLALTAVVIGGGIFYEFTREGAAVYKVPVAQAKRGDLIFWGPGGSQHVAMYLGGGRMLEASGSAGKVTVSPVRTSGLQPYAARIIES